MNFYMIYGTCDYVRVKFINLHMIVYAVKETHSKSVPYTTRCYAIAPETSVFAKVMLSLALCLSAPLPPPLSLSQALAAAA